MLPAEPERRSGFGLSEEQARAAVEALDLDPAAVTLVAAGDIARCEELAPSATTAKLLDAVVSAASNTIVITTGDHAYKRGTRVEFERCYGPTWGRFETLTRPSPGNHDYDSGSAAPYFDYFSHFDRNPQDRARGYYSFELPGWHMVSLNSVLPIEEGSAQLAWLTEDLRSARAGCVLAYWHHPRFSSGIRSANPWYRGRRLERAWSLLTEHGAEIIINGHEHFYERFAPQTSSGELAADGIRQFTVGTGGGDLQSAFFKRANRENVYDEGYGVLVMALERDGYRWAFVGGDGRVHDRGEAAAACDGSAAATEFRSLPD
jgi:hypothetical protein